MKRKIIAVIAGILIFGWAYWLVPYSPIPDTVNITECGCISLTGENTLMISPSG